MEEILTSAISFLAPVVETFGALVIVLEAARTIIHYVLNYFRRRPVHISTLRRRLGRSM